LKRGDGGGVGWSKGLALWVVRGEGKRRLLGGDEKGRGEELLRRRGGFVVNRGKTRRVNEKCLESRKAWEVMS